MNKILLAISAVIASQTTAKPGTLTETQKQDNKTHAESETAKIRELAVIAQESGISFPTLADEYALQAAAYGVPAGSIKATKPTIEGFMLAVGAGLDVNTGGGKAKTAPRSAAWARDYRAEVKMTDDDRAKASIVARFAEWVKTAHLDTLEKMAAEYLPELTTEAGPVKKETAAERVQREAKERMLARAMSPLELELALKEQDNDTGEDSEESEAEPATPVAQAA